VSVFRNFERRETYLSRPHRELERFLQRKRLALREEKMDALKLPEETRILLREPLNKNNSGQRHFYKQYDPQLRFTDAEFRAWLTLQDRATLERLERETAGGGPELEKAVIVVDSGLPPRNAHILDRGSVRAKKDQVPFGFLSVLSRGKEPHVSGASRRRALAEWLTDPESGAGNLLARVVVNRMWQHHFGEGLVRTPNDFGLQGDAPSHPELLDWLASELIRSGWRLKPIHKLIIMSSAYRQGAGSNPQKLAADPENRLLSRRRPVKLQGEVLRDSILSVSGSLNAKMFGPAVRPPIPESATATRSASKWPKDLKEGPEVWRRTIYVFNKRSIRIPWLETFDAPDWISSCGRRVPTTVPTQALTLLNDPFVREQSRRFAERIRSEEPADAHAQVNRAYRLAVGRAPSQSEEGDSVQFLQQGGRLPDFCHVLLTLNEFLYVD
ncbi:MAG TPA: DUF1553 domain-containing protein, partial [Bryobacteraceae bacterium]|nr:DUF1553 domain-containing protein [Bryobacteraceae bacterium]